MHFSFIQLCLYNLNGLCKENPKYYCLILSPHTQTGFMTHFLFTGSGVACSSTVMTHLEASDSDSELTERLSRRSSEAVRIHYQHEK